MKSLSLRQRKFVSRVYHLLDQVPRKAVDGLLTAQNRREWTLARERFEGELVQLGIPLPDGKAPRAIRAEQIVGRRLREIVGPPESDPFEVERRNARNHEKVLTGLLRAGFVADIHTLAKDLAPGWCKRRCRFHGVLPQRSTKGHWHRLCFYLRSEIEKYSTPEHTQAWTSHLEQEKALRAAEQQRQDEAESLRLDFESRKKDGSLITRQEIIQKGWQVPAYPDFVEPLGRGYIRYYYRLPIPIVLVKRRDRRDPPERRVANGT